ncbi:calpain small subunit 2-like [Tubulanus polymorphus]|uniref:calpain small subunit 2-like n=1 Tax=Tubulanus polymorphus TaxID=672921 RepID=UPI003DA450C2
MTSTDDFQKFEAFCKKYKVPEVAADLKEAFIVFRQTDKNKDGSLDMEEIKKLGLSEKSNKEIIAAGGADGKITLAELIKFIFLPNVEEKWKKIFKEANTDHNDTIGPDEMEGYLKKCGFEMADVECAIAVIETYDTNEDKRLSINEFLKYITHDFDALVDTLSDSTSKK